MPTWMTRHSKIVCMEHKYKPSTYQPLLLTSWSSLSFRTQVILRLFLHLPIETLHSSSTSSHPDRGTAKWFRCQNHNEKMEGDVNLIKFLRYNLTVAITTELNNSMNKAEGLEPLILKAKPNKSRSFIILQLPIWETARGTTVTSTKWTILLQHGQQT